MYYYYTTTTTTATATATATATTAATATATATATTTTTTLPLLQDPIATHPHPLADMGDPRMGCRTKMMSDMHLIQCKKVLIGKHVFRESFGGSGGLGASGLGGDRS